MSADYPIYKITLIGSIGCGKSSFLKRWTNNDISYSKIIRPPPFTYCVNGVVIETIDKDVQINVWKLNVDKSELFDLYFRGAMGCIIMFDVSSKDSFEETKMVYTQIKNYLIADIPVALVGHKSDLNREVSIDTACIYADDHKMLYFETTIHDDSINNFFRAMADEINTRMYQPTCPPIRLVSPKKFDKLSESDSSKFTCCIM